MNLIQILKIFFLYLTLVQSKNIDYERLMHPEIFTSDAESIAKHINEFESSYWQNIGQGIVHESIVKTINTKIAKNIIIFIGDGLSVGTITASRAYLGDTANNLFFETFPYTGMAKTYCLDKQVSDSASTSTAYFCGVKANYATAGVSGKVTRGDCKESTKPENHLPSIAKWAMDSGKAAGLVTTTRVTHASPVSIQNY